MKKRKINLRIRKTHRYLGLFLGIQFLLWTVSGMYFSWTDLDEIHGDHFRNPDFKPLAFDDLISPSKMMDPASVNSIELRDINKTPYYWINQSQLYNARNGKIKHGITEQEAIYIAKNHLKSDLEIESVERIEQAGKHHEYREKLLPAYVISYKTDEQLKAYVSIADGKFQTVRHRNWRWFDFLWMTHTMDYETRDNFNTSILRAFSLLGLITVLSGFLLWFTSSQSIRKLRLRNRRS